MEGGAGYPAGGALRCSRTRMAACSEAPDSGPAAVAEGTPVVAGGTANKGGEATAAATEDVAGAAGDSTETPAARANAGQAIAGNRQSAARKRRDFSMGLAGELASAAGEKRRAGICNSIPFRFSVQEARISPLYRAAFTIQAPLRAYRHVTGKPLTGPRQSRPEPEESRPGALIPAFLQRRY